MSSGRDWTKARQRQQIARHGAESIGEESYRDRLARQADALLKAGPKPTHQSASRDVTHRHAPSRVTPPAQNSAGLVVYADGCCEPNPGAGGWGFVAYLDGVEFHSEHGGELETTNNQMELTGALMALRWLAFERCQFGRLLCDSQYVVKGCNEWRHGWKRKGWRRAGDGAKAENQAVANLELWKALDEILTSMPLTLEWCRGHSGIVGNERADELSLIGRQQAIDDSRRSPPEEQFARYEALR